METQKLPVYNALRALFVQFEKSTNKSPVNLKRGSIAWIEETIIGMMCDVSFANSVDGRPEERAAFIESAIMKLQRVEVRARTLYDLHFVKRKGYDAIIREESVVMRQLVGWSRSTTTKNEQ